MAKPILPHALRVKVMELDAQGYSTIEIERLIYDEAQQYLQPGQDIQKCISSIKGKRTLGYSPKK